MVAGIALRITDEYRSTLPQLRYHRTPKRVRANVGGATVVDSTAARIVWEPRRIVPQYAVPVADVAATLTEAEGDALAENPVQMIEARVLDPSTGFAAHTCPGQSFTLTAGERELSGAAFAPADPDLAGYVLLDFDAFDQWLEEDEEVVGHPRDPRSRIDIRSSSRHVVLEVDGTVVADSHRPMMLFETFLPVRYYLPREDVRTDLFQPSDKRSTCAYKGHATYWSVVIDGSVTPDLAWTYPDPLEDARRIAGLIAFFDERVDVTLDGTRLERPITPWSSAPRT